MMIDDVLHALVEPRRRDILDLIRNQEMTAGDIAGRFDVTRPAISQHLKVLEEAQLVNIRAQGTRRLYSARPQGLAELRRYIDGYWDIHLARLKAAAEKAEREGDTGDAQ